jgi:hypothetical protein
MSEENRYVTEAGKYLAVVKSPGNGWFGEAGAKASPFIRIPVKIKQGGEQTGREIVWRGYLTPGAFDNTIKTLTKAFGWDGDIEAVTEGKVDPFTGKECQVVCEEEEYDGKTIIKVRWLNSAQPSGPALDKNKLKAIAQLTKKAKSVAKTALEDSDEGVWAPTPSEKSKPEADDDIPF